MKELNKTILNENSKITAIAATVPGYPEASSVFYVMTDCQISKEDILQAIKDSAMEFCRTKEGLAALQDTGGDFNYGDFLEYVPKHILEKHGLKMLPDHYDEVITVNHDDCLINAEQIAECMDLSVQVTFSWPARSGAAVPPNFCFEVSSNNDTAWLEFSDEEYRDTDSKSDAYVFTGKEMDPSSDTAILTDGFLENAEKVTVSIVPCVAAEITGITFYKDGKKIRIPKERIEVSAD